MSAETLKRPTPPELEFRAPDCPMCARETDCDGDSFSCPDCGASWDRDGSGGEWDNPDEPGCPASYEPFNTGTLDPKHESVRHHAERCILPADHRGKHRAFEEWFAWTDDDPRVLTSGEVAR